ncbi:MAG: PH domain-containing protein [Pseudonocardiaceae bacterium]|nr:PH domain-containing protein [Pseudonocardiaceae bacterium]
MTEWTTQPTGSIGQGAPAAATGGTVRLRPPRHRVDPRAIWWWTTQWLGLAVPVIAGVWIAVAFTAGVLSYGWLIALAVTLVVIAVVLVEPRWSYAVSRWEVTDEAVYTRTGWFVRRWRVAPMSRIQRVDNARGPVQRLFGLSSVTVTTASSAGAISIDGLDHELARDLVEQLTRTTHAIPGDAT